MLHSVSRNTPNVDRMWIRTVDFSATRICRSRIDKTVATQRRVWRDRPTRTGRSGVKSDLVLQLRTAFRREAADCLAVLRAVESTTEVEPEVLRRAAHTLRGGAAICGLDEVRNLSEELEELLKLACDRGTILANDRHQVLTSVASLEALLCSLAVPLTDASPDGSDEVEA